MGANIIILMENSQTRRGDNYFGRNGNREFCVRPRRLSINCHCILAKLYASFVPYHTCV
jgi:hypothetical protein